MFRIGRALLVQLLTLRKSLVSPDPDHLHAKYFGYLCKAPVPCRDRALPSQGQAWADTLATWLEPTEGHGEGEERCEDLDEYQIWVDKQSQKFGLKLLVLLNRAS